MDTPLRGVYIPKLCNIFNSTPALTTVDSFAPNVTCTNRRNMSPLRRRRKTSKSTRGYLKYRRTYVRCAHPAGNNYCLWERPKTTAKTPTLATQN